MKRYALAENGYENDMTASRLHHEIYLSDASETLRIVRIGDYDDCACIGAHVGNTSEIGEFRIISHDFNDGAWRVRWKVGAKQQRITLIDQKLNARPTPLLVAPSDRLGALLFLSGFTYVLL